MEYGQIKRREDSGLLTNVQFKDSRTGKEFNLHHTMKDLCVCQMTTLYLREMLVWRISGLLFEESRQFVPNANDIFTIDPIFTYVKLLEGNRVDERSLYANW